MGRISLKILRGAALAGGVLGLTVGLGGCGRSSGSGGGADASAPPSSGGSDRAYASERGGGQRGGGYGGYGGRDDRPPVPSFHGEPMWSQNRSHTAKENAEYHYERAGKDLGSNTLDDFLTKVHRFGDHPPAGTLKFVRSNGDKLLYDPKANLFAVFTRDGAPRTVFKPESGMDYWNEQKQREQADNGGGSGGGGYRHRSYGGSGGGYGGERYGRSGGGGSGDSSD